MKLVIKVYNEKILDRLLWLLNHFEKDCIEIIEKEESKGTKWTYEYIEKHWKELGMETNSSDLDDDERLYETSGEFYHRG